MGIVSAGRLEAGMANLRHLSASVMGQGGRRARCPEEATAAANMTAQVPPMRRIVHSRVFRAEAHEKKTLAILAFWRTRIGTWKGAKRIQVYISADIANFVRHRTCILKHKRPARSGWSPISWQSKPAAQQPVYPNAEALRRVLARLAKLPPLVTSWEIENLKQQLAAAQRDEWFMLQGGDCSESFEECESAAIASKLKILLQMSLMLVQGGKKRVIRIGRFAGQYAKPRSADMETRGGLTLPSYRGDMINEAGFSLAERTQTRSCSCAPTSVRV